MPQKTKEYFQNIFLLHIRVCKEFRNNFNNEDARNRNWKLLGRLLKYKECCNRVKIQLNSF